LNFLRRKQGRLASGEMLAPDRVKIRDLLQLVLEDYDVRGVTQAYIAGLKVKSILNPKLGDIKAVKLTTEQINQYIRDRRKRVRPSTVIESWGFYTAPSNWGINTIPHWSDEFPVSRNCRKANHAKAS